MHNSVLNNTCTHQVLSTITTSLTGNTGHTIQVIQVITKPQTTDTQQTVTYQLHIEFSYYTPPFLDLHPRCVGWTVSRQVRQYVISRVTRVYLIRR